MAEVVGVKFKEVGKVYYFSPDSKKFEKGDNAFGAPSSAVPNESDNVKIKFADNVVFDNCSFSYND